MRKAGLARVRAIVFDVFGTVVDWRGSLREGMQAFARARGIDADWQKLADDWRAAYHPSMDRVRRGELPWTNLDALHRSSLDELVERLGLPIDEAGRAELVSLWHRLSPWPDSVPGLVRLRARYTVGTLSNGNVALLVDMAKHARLPWDVVLSAEIIRRYKPDPQCYRMAMELLGAGPGEIMLAAAHNSDLRAAANEGFCTAFIARPTEYGPRQTRDLSADDFVDVAAASVEDLATKLGA
jgi:2-haloacid dehalogenase